MEAHDDTNLDGWLIGRLRDAPRASRLGELLLDERSATARIEELEARLALYERPTAPRGHVLFRPTANGYALVEADGPAPEPDSPVLVDGRRYRVLRAGRSPFPGDRRPCLYLADD